MTPESQADVRCTKLAHTKCLFCVECYKDLSPICGWTWTVHVYQIFPVLQFSDGKRQASFS